MEGVCFIFPVSSSLSVTKSAAQPQRGGDRRYGSNRCVVSVNVGKVGQEGKVPSGGFERLVELKWTRRDVFLHSELHYTSGFKRQNSETCIHPEKLQTKAFADRFTIV